MSRHTDLGPVGFSGVEGVSGHSMEPGMGAREPPEFFQHILTCSWALWL